MNKNALNAYREAASNLPLLSASVASMNEISPRALAVARLATGNPKSEGEGEPESPSAAWVWEDEDEGDSDANLIITQDGLAVVKVVGVLVPWARRWWYGSSLCSTPDTQEALEQVQAGYESGSIKRCLLYMDSPGGFTSGIKGCGDAIMALRRAGCPVWAAGPEMCSAAYWLASQAGRILVPEDGTAGCIGTIILAADYSKMMAEWGVQVNRLTSTGAETYKGAGAFGTEITPEQKAMFTRMCDEAQSLFNAAIAEGRGVQLSQAVAWADGQAWGGVNALSMGLVDELASPEDVLVTLSAMDVDIDAGPDPGCPDDEEDDGEDPPSTLPDDEEKKKSFRLPSIAALRSGKTGSRTPKENPVKGFFDQLRAAKEKPEAERNANEKEAATVVEVGEQLAQENKLLKAEKTALEGKLEKAEGDLASLQALCAPASGEGDSAQPAGRLFAAAQQLALSNATRAHGAGSTGLQSEKASIEAATTVEGLLDIAEKCAAIVPTAFAKTNRQTAGDDTTGDVSGKNKSESPSAYAAQVAADNPRFAKLQAEKAKAEKGN